MPALSPTMTEGNIANWKVKEGDSFSAGDVLLEIETDKASMDVEAQDDGVVAKILQGDGSKGIKVGTRIGVLAEPGDDLKTLEIPTEEDSKLHSPNEEARQLDPETTSESQAEAPPTSKLSAEGSIGSPEPAASSSHDSKSHAPTLLPSVEHLLREHGIDHSLVKNITPTGPNRRLLKGDVLAFIGSISKSYPAELSQRIAKLSHLDLANIKIAARTPAPESAAPDAATASTEKVDIEVAVPVSMEAVIDVQKRMHSTLGVFLPLSEFIARATDAANEGLPRPKTDAPSSDELFNEVLGLSTRHSKSIRGRYLPRISPILPTTPRAPITSRPARHGDIYDMLTSSFAAATPKEPPRSAGLSSGMNLLSLKVSEEQAEQATIFLDRVKSVLEAEPGRLVV